MEYLKIGTRVQVIHESRYGFYGVGDCGTIVKVDPLDSDVPYRVKFDQGSLGLLFDGIWWCFADDICELKIVDGNAAYVNAGVVSAMPGADGYTMVVFKNEDVPVGTVVFVQK